MNVLEFLDDVNRMQLFRDENLNNAFLALLTLITVLAVHDIIESLFVRADDNLGEGTMWRLIMMRSHSSPSRMWGLWNNHVLYKGRYHGPKCRCDLAHRSDSEFCPLSRLRATGYSRKVIVQSLFIRGTILLIEVAAICMAFSQHRDTMVQQNVFAITPFSNDFGNRTNIPSGEGCGEILKLLNKRPKGNRVIDQRTTLTLCTVSHNPFEPETDRNLTIPPGYTPYYLYIDLSGDKVTFSHAEQKLVGSEMYMYWKSDGLPNRKPTGLMNTSELTEAVVATVVDGKEYSPNRDKRYTKEETAVWHRKLDKYLNETFGDGYYKSYEQVEFDSHPVPRMLMSFNLNTLEGKTDRDKVVRLLQKIVGPQLRPNGGKFIHFSTGSEMDKLDVQAVEYTETGPFVGYIPWMITLSFIIIFRAVLSARRPNATYELLMESIREHDAEIQAAYVGNLEVLEPNSILPTPGASPRESPLHSWRRRDHKWLSEGFTSSSSSSNSFKT